AAKRRERRMKKPVEGNEEQEKQVKELQNAMEAISDKKHSMARAITMEDIDAAHQVRSDNRKVLQAFEATNARIKDLQTQRLRTSRTWNKLGEAGREQHERKYKKGLFFFINGYGWILVFSNDF
ncbi:hypothetical protein BGZ65_012830, partial [Modicella reniformis]